MKEDDSQVRLTSLVSKPTLVPLLLDTAASQPYHPSPGPLQNNGFHGISHNFLWISKRRTAKISGFLILNADDAVAIPSPHQVASVAVPGLPVSRSREIRPGFTMTAQRQGRHSDGR